MGVVLLDLDGVVADFVSASLVAHGRSESHDDITTWGYYREWGLTDGEFWEPMKSHGFWAGIEPYHGAIWFYNELKKKHRIVISTSPFDSPGCVSGKMEWCRKHLGIGVGDMMIGRKKYLLANSGVLIDDSTSNVDQFNDNGGFAYGFKRPWNNFTHTYESLLKVL